MVSDDIFFVLKVIAVNEAPVWSGAFEDVSVTVGEVFEINLPGFLELDLRDEHTIEVEGDGISGFVTHDGEFKITIEPDSNEQAGSYDITVTVTDNDSAGTGEKKSD